MSTPDRNRTLRTHQKGDEDEGEANSNDHRRNGRHVPRYACISTCPSQEEYPDNQDRACSHPTEKSVFRRRRAAPLRNQLFVPPPKPNIDDGTNGGAEANTDEDQSGQAGGKSAQLLPDKRECLEEAIKQAVDNGEVDGDQHKDRLKGKHLEGPEDCALEDTLC